MCEPGTVVLRIDGTLVISHSKKDRSAGTFKRTFGHHPLACWIDNTGELASLMLRAGNAGSNTATDLIAVLAEAIAQVPKDYRRKLLVTCDAAGASHDLVNWLIRQNHARDRRIGFSIGFDIDADVRAAITMLRADCWVPALDNTTGAARDDADVADITNLMRPRVQRCGWPNSLTFTVRRTKLAPGEQPTLFTLNGYKYSCFVTSKTTLTVQKRDARHRVHARVEDRVRTTKNTGLDHLPSKSWDVNLGWCHAVSIATDLIAWFRLLCCDGELTKAEPQTLRYRLFTTPARLTRGQRLRWLRLPANWPWAHTLVTAVNKIRVLTATPAGIAGTPPTRQPGGPRRPRHRRDSGQTLTPAPSTDRQVSTKADQTRGRARPDEESGLIGQGGQDGRRTGQESDPTSLARRNTPGRPQPQDRPRTSAASRA
jgi:hypothetical protein